MNNKDIIPLDIDTIRTKIHFVRGQQVMLDNDLAEIYGVETKVFNQAVKRNNERFPEYFCFQLTEEEFDTLRSQFVTLKRTGRGQHRKYLPFVFTEQGISMLSAVLHSETAIQVSIKIINTFVEMRRFIYNNAQIFTRLDLVEKKQISFELETEKKFENLFQALEKSQESPKQGIFYDGQVYDAYIFVCNLIRKAKKSLVLVDNYVDESVLSLLSKRADGITTIIYTKSVSKQLALDLKKHNEQYSQITIKVFENSHDRFLIIDEKEIYHIGASLKDLGKKWFAFSRLELGAVEVLQKLKGSNAD
ncbi:MAG: DNA-binding protein [Gammaproteobacteria bacterium GWE2_37_16]|nr:MAG: DNA-binding protein [Gammaproteobacteria bacterium GWE2_37_16]